MALEQTNKKQNSFTIKKIALNLLKVAITSAGLYFAYGKFDWAQLRGAYQDIRWGYYIAAFLAGVSLIWTNSWRLKLISGFDIRVLELIKLNLIARFFSLFLPSSVGGDLIRTIRFRKYTQTGSKSLSVIFIDRFLGMTAMIVLGTAFFLLPILDKSILADWVIYVIIATFLLVVTIWLFIWIDFLSKLAFKLIDLIPFEIVRVKFSRFYKDILELRDIPKQNTIKALMFSLITQFMSSFSYYLVSESLNLQIGAVHYFVTIPVVSMLLLLPISINGIGARDYLFKNLYQPLTSNSNYILLAPMAFLVNLITGGIGGLIYLIEGRQAQKHLKSQKASKTNE
jgi:hypothetical protein